MPDPQDQRRSSGPRTDPRDGPQPAPIGGLPIGLGQGRRMETAAAPHLDRLGSDGDLAAGSLDGIDIFDAG